MKTGAIIGTGLGVSAATGGVGLVPYLYGVGAATGVSIALDGTVQTRLARGDYLGAANQASYYLPVLGNFRSGLEAWQQGNRSEAACYVGLSGAEAFGAGWAWRTTARAGVGSVRAGAVERGEWVVTKEAMSSQARGYQNFITGRVAKESYKVNGVKFDGVKNGVLLDAKSGYANFVTKDGKFLPFSRGEQGILHQARRQTAAAKGMPIEWHFEHGSVKKAFEKLLESKEYTKKIKLIHTSIPQ